MHPDAWIPNEEGEFHRGAAYPVGKAACEAAGLPKMLHVYGTDEEFDTARLVGDVGLILKDVGGVSLIGMVALHDVLNIFLEAPFMLTQAARSNAHHGEDAMLALKILQWCKFDFDRAVEIFSRRGEHSFDPETTMVAVNTVARKAEQVRRGPVTKMMIAATEPIRTRALYNRALPPAVSLPPVQAWKRWWMAWTVTGRQWLKSGRHRWSPKRWGKRYPSAWSKATRGTRKAS